jgi:protein disulfide-isomerase A1
MVQFYAPWCAHCRALAPDYAAAAASLAAQQADVALAKVDATEDAELTEQYGVQGFPTLLFFVDGVHKEYTGDRTKYAADILHTGETLLTAVTFSQSLIGEFLFCLCNSRDAILAWITKKLGPEVQNLTTADEAERVLTGEETAVLAFLHSLSVRTTHLRSQHRPRQSNCLLETAAKQAMLPIQLKDRPPLYA